MRRNRPYRWGAKSYGLSNYVAVGDTTTPATTTTPSSTPDVSTAISDAINSDAVKTVSGGVLLFHGYRRTGSILWALLYGLAGKHYPEIAVPIALAQGVGKKKPCP